MSTASIMSGLLNASGLKERLSEYGGKAKPPSADFPLMEKQEPGNGMPEGRFLERFEDVAEIRDAAVSEEDMSAQETLAVDEASIEGDTLPFADGEAETSDIPAAMDEGLLLDGMAAKPVNLMAAAGVSLNLQEQANPAKASAEADYIKADTSAGRSGHDTRAQLPSRSIGDAEVIRGDASLATQSAQASSRLGARELFPGSTPAGEFRQQQSASDSVMNPGLGRRIAQASGNAPLVTVTDFTMASAKADYPANFAEKFSRQLDMMRPVFRAPSGSDGLARAGEASSQAMLLPSGTMVSGTLQQVQQAIQTSLVALAQESKGSSPTAKTMELSLVPRSLGEIKLHMMHTGNRISVEIVTSTVAATQAMETAKNDIVKAYLQFGIQPEEVNIRVTETREAAQPTLQANSEQDRFGQGNGQGLARQGAGSSMAERQEAARQQETGASSAAGGEGPRPAETAKPTRSDVMGKVQYF